MNILIAMDRQNGQHLAGEAFLRNYYAGETITTKDLNGVTSGDATTWVGTLVANTYTKIHVLVVVDTAGGTGELSWDNYAAMIPSLLTTSLPTALSSGTCQANATVTEIILASGEVATNDEYNDDYIVTLGTTAVQKVITDSVASTDTVTVTSTVTAITTTETYIVYDDADIVLLMPIYDDTYEGYEVFTELYASMTNVPVLVEQLAAMPATGTKTATADSVATTSGVSTLTDAANFTADAYDDNTHYVAIRSATLGAGQILEIDSNTAGVLTLADQWSPVPTGTIVYEVVDRRDVAIARYLLQFAFRHLVPDPSNAAQLKLVMKMVSKNETIAQTDTLLFQDLDELRSFKDVGQTIMRSIGQGITS